jgi:ecotin
MKPLLTLLVAGLMIHSVMAGAVNNDPKAFPPAEPGFERFVLPLPKEAHEENLKLELQVGQTVETDAANRYFLGGRIEEETIKGWGYTRYLVKQVGPMAGTLMAVDPKQPKTPRFVTLGGEPYLIRYNSKLPVVVYVPKGTEVRYRVWRADGLVLPMEKG